VSAAKHTPGPWFIFGNGHCVGGANTDPTTLAEHQSAGIAMCGMARRDPTECEANARLIAAAPELLALLKDRRDACGAMVHDELAALTDEVIAKATGEAA